MIKIMFQFWEKEGNLEIFQILGIFTTQYHKKEGVMGEMRSRTRGLEKTSEQLPCVALSMP